MVETSKTPRTPTRPTSRTSPAHSKRLIVLGFTLLLLLNIGLFITVVFMLTKFSDIDDCSTNKCQNNGTCINSRIDYICVCPIMWHGKNCEKARNTLGIQCQPGFTGSFCETVIEVEVKKISSPYVSFNKSNTDWPGARELGAFEFNRKIHVWGGYGRSGYLPSKYVWILDLSTETWTREETTGDVPGGRRTFASAFLDGKFYVMGGWDNSRKDSFVYDPLTKAWKKMSDMPENRYRGCTWTYRKSVYVFGGVVASGAYFNNVLRLNVTSNEWSKIETSGTVPIARNDMGCSRSGDRLFVYGGIRIMLLNDLHVLNLMTRVWERVTGPNFRALQGLTIDFVTPRLLLIIGGYDDNDSNQYQLFDVLTKSVVKSGNIDDSVSYHSTVMVGDKLYVVGGENNNHIYDFMVRPKT